MTLTEIEKAIKIVNAEMSMRFIVFKNNPEKQQTKMNEMRLLKETLEELKKDYKPSLLLILINNYD